MSRRVAENPWTYFKWYIWGKLTTVFSWDIIAGMGDIFIYPVIKTPYSDNLLFQITRFTMMLIHPLLIALSFIGTLLAWLSITKYLPSNFLWTLRLLSLLMLYFIILHIIGAPYPRYSIPMRPITYGMAVVVLAWLFRYKYVSNNPSHSCV